MNDELIAGDTLDFRDTVDAYPPSDGWTLKYRLIPRFATPSQDPIDITASSSGTQYRVQAAADITKNWVPGFYTWSRWVEKAGPIRQSLGSGQLRVLDNPAAALQGLDTRTHARKMLDSIETAQLALKGGTKSYTIGSRSYTARDLDELRGDREYWARTVAAELNEELLNSGGQPGRRLLARL